MNNRNELAKLLFIADNHAAKWGEKEWELLKEDSRNMQYVYDMADAILAAGYSRPRTVSTVAELDALPEGAVILAESTGDSYQKNHEDEWFIWGGGGRDAADVDLPASVLYEPEGK